MSNAAIQPVVVTEETGDDLTLAFSPMTFADMEVQGVIVYRTEVSMPPWVALIPGLDDLDETILAPPVPDTVFIEMSPVRGG